MPAGPPPKAAQTETGPVHFCDTQSAATSDPANVPTKAAPFDYAKVSETQFYRMAPTPDVDRGPIADAAIQQQPTWTPPHTIPRPPWIHQFTRGNFYRHDRYGQVRFLSLIEDESRETQCKMMQWDERRGTTIDVVLPARELWSVASTGILLNPTLRSLPRIEYFTDAPITDDQQYVQCDDVELLPGTMLLAAHNFNVQGDQASCMGGQYQETNDDLEKGVLEVRTGDLVRYNSKTKYPNICFGRTHQEHIRHSTDG